MHRSIKELHKEAKRRRTLEKAAPLLLEACEEAVKYYLGHGKSKTQGEILEILQQAIEKATS